MKFGTLLNMPTNWIIVWGITSISVIWLTSHGRRRLMPKSYLWTSVVLRLVIITLLMLLFINPFTEVSKPDSSAFRIAVLADTSGSMETKDMPDGRSRLDHLSSYLESKQFDQLQKKYPNAELYSFSDHPVRTESQQLYTLPGRSAIGHALKQISGSESDLPLGAVLLLSDGKSNEGVSLTDAAKDCRKAGIPVSSAGFGSQRKAEDIAVKAPEKRLKVERGKKLVIPIKVSSTFRKEMSVTLECYDGSEILESRQIVIPAGKTAEENLTVQPMIAGVKAYRFKVKASERDSRPETNIDYASVEVEPPPFFKVLHLSSQPNLQARFLKIALQGHSGLKFFSLTRISDKKVMSYGDEEGMEKIKDKFPEEQAFYNKFDVIIADPTMPAENSGKISKLLASFVSNRGGGLLFCGDAELLPESLRKVIPVKEWSKGFDATVKYLDVSGHFIFPEAETELLRSAPGPDIPAYTNYVFSTALKPGARPGLSMQKGDRHLLAAQQYGSGRVACMGASHDWKWHFKDGPSERHLSFWSSLLSWLGSSAKPRITLPFNGSKLPLNEEIKLSAKVLDQEFQPSIAADVSAIIKHPDGSASELQMGFSASDAGLFSESFIPPQPGEYQLSLYASFPDGHTVEQKGAFIAVPMSGEMSDTTFMENILRDVCRISGGKYFANAQQIEQLETADNLPVKYEKIMWFSLPLLPFILLALIALEIYIRRRLGLK